MNNKQVLSALLTVIIVLTIATSMAAATDDGGCSITPTQEVQFMNDSLKSRIDDILTEDKSVFLFFYADWCPYCRQETPIIEQLEEERAGDVTVIRINVTSRPDHAAEFGVSGLPTMVVISGKEEDGYAREEISGFVKKAELSAIIAPGEGDELGDVGDDVDVMAPLATSTTCNSCEDCTEKLKSGEYDVVTLTTDITDHKGSCIGLIMGESNVVFDCGGHTIDGDDIAIDPDHGVAMMHGAGNTIKNCVISDFSNGIHLWDATDHEITGNTVISNDEGIELGWSDSNTIDDNTVNENYNGIVLSNSNSNTINSNTVCKNTNSDFLIESGTGNSGDENVCDTTSSWNDDGMRSGCTYDCTSGKPDLVITDVRSEDGTICYEIQNIGDATASEGHYTTLLVDGLYRIKEQVDVDLAPGSSVERCFDYYAWNCTSSEDAVEVCADYGDFVDESNEENNCLNVTWACAPLGDAIIYHADYGAGIWRMNPDGSENTQLSDHGWFAEYSPDNTKIAFGEYYQNGIWVMDSDGTGQVQLTSSGNAPTWSPDGARIAYHVGGTTVTARSIWVMDADGSNTQKLSDSPGDFPAWSPDGTKIAYTGELDNDIRLINPDGTGDTQLCAHSRDPAWYPDGKKIAYRSSADGCIWTMNADGSGNVKISANAGRHPAWSSDGTKIAYEDAANKMGIWVIGADGTDEHLINQGGHAPDWMSPGIVEKLPDLVITDVWNEEGRICYRIENIGGTVAPGGHCTAVYVDGFYQAEDCVEEDLAPGAGMDRCFEYDWECRPPEDVVLVCADIGGIVPDQVNDIETGNSSGCGTPPMGVGSLFQSFTPSATHLTAVDLQLRAGGEFPAEGYTTTIGIRSGTFDGYVLATATAFVPDPAQSVVNFELSPPIEITSGATYLIEWISPEEGGKVLTWMVAEDDPYLGGTAFGCTGTAIPDEDFIFTTYTTLDHVDESNEENNCIEGVFECAPSGSECVDFEDLSIGAMYYVGDAFTDSGAKITVQPFQWGDGQWTQGGFAEVGNAGDAGGAGNEVLVNNVNLGFDFGRQCGGLSLLFGEYGGNLNIEINGDFRNFKDFAGINGTVVGNVSVTVVNGPNDYIGHLELSGTINSFAIGGQELWLDYVCPIGAGGCVIPTDDLYINSDTTLCPGFYDIPDAGADGVIIINADGVVLDCNSATINGTGAGYGIYNYGFDNVTVKDGNVLNYRIGVHMRTYADYNTIINNNLSLNTIAGIELFAASYNMIANNTASSNDGWGIYLELQADNNIVVNNIANSNKVDGIRMEDSSCGNTVRYNIVNSNTANGIHLESSSNHNELIRNVASSNEQNGIHLRDRASNNTLANNSISDNANCGIYFTSDSTGNLVSGNLVCSNSVDIYDEDGNSGDENRCGTTHNWNDAGKTTGCTHTCISPGSGVCYDYTTASWMTPPATTDWNVDHIIVCNDTAITLNGDLTIDSGGELDFNNVTLRMNATETEADKYSIEVNSGGAFHINSKDGSPSILTNGDNTTAYYTFHVNSGSQFTMQNSELHNCGYDWKELPNKDAGLWINTDDTLLVNNTITGNYYVGAFFYQSDNHTVVDNTVKLNRWHGIRLIASNGSRIIGNSVESTIDGITLSHSPDGEILNNVVSSNQDGITVSHSPDATIAENTASSNGRYGIRVTSSSDCGVRNNTANSNADGIMISSSIRAIITGNTADSNRDDGIYLSDSPDSVVMDNTANLNNRAVDIGTGLVVLSSPHTEVELNVVTSNWRGMFIDSSSGCMVSENNASDNMWYGIHLNSSRANNLTENVLYSNKGQWDSAGLHLSESEDNRIIGNYATANLHGMVLYKSPNSGIAGNAVDGNDEDGIALDSSDGIEIVENTVTANSVGISLHDSDNVEIIHNNASGNGHTGISLSASKNNLIIENVAVRNRYGIALSSSSVNEICNNTATSNNFGMSLRWSSNNNTATSNNFDSSTDYGANLFRVYNNTILHNNFSNSGSVGVGLERSDRNLVVDNDMRLAHNYGIDLFESRWNVIEMNNVRYSGDVGIGLSSSNGNMVAGNTAEGSGTGVSIRFSDDNTVAENNANSNDIGIYMRNSDSNTITGNNVSLSDNVGIDLSISDGNGIFANTAFGNPNYGIHLYSSASNILDGNNVTSNGVGIYLDWSDDNLISANTVDENDLTGIALYMSSDENEVIGNEVNSNGNISIRISSSDNNTVMDNTALYNGIGIFLDWSKGNIIADNRADLNKYHGISLDWFSCDNEIVNNSASSNIVGIALSWSGNNTIADNVANFNNVSILMEWSSSNNELIGNTANHNEHNGISLHWSSNDNEITGNTANDNRIGLYFDSNSTGNVVADNTFCNNSLYDIQDEDTNSGEENTCNSTLNWDDDGATGCTYACGTEPSPTPTPTPTQPTPVPDGDLNGDGEVTPADAAITIQDVARGVWNAAADVSGDGRVTSLDGLMILQAAAGRLES